jgi:hypothetical protein
VHEALPAADLDRSAGADEIRLFLQGANDVFIANEETDLTVAELRFEFSGERDAGKLPDNGVREFRGDAAFKAVAFHVLAFELISHHLAGSHVNALAGGVGEGGYLAEQEVDFVHGRFPPWSILKYKILKVKYWKTRHR